MSIKYAVLGLLTERRGYGYDLVNRLQERLGPDFAGTGAVYISLDHLTRDELAVESERVPFGRQMKILYEATEAGRDRFSEFMSHPSGREPLRGELYLKLAVAQGEHLPFLQADLERLERECLTDLHERAAAVDLNADPRELVPWKVAARWLTDAAALERLNGDLHWIRMALQAIRSAGSDGTVARHALRRVASSGGA